MAGAPVVAKERFSKTYRHPDLDAKLTRQRVLTEARCLAKARRAGLDVPALLLVDPDKSRIFMERVAGPAVKARLRELHAASKSAAAASAAGPEGRYGDEGLALARSIGAAVARLHNNDVVHGDLTTSNLMLRGASHPETAPGSTPAAGPGASKSREDPAGVVVIDFGLAGVSAMHEDKAVDLYVLERAFLSTHADSKPLVDEVGSSTCQTHEAAREKSRPPCPVCLLCCRPRLKHMDGAACPPFLCFDNIIHSIISTFTSVQVLRVFKADATRSDAIMQKLAAVRQRGRKRECFG